jgi:mannose-6-phosphate isomerase-like protein (cupin superfamily)
VAARGLNRPWHVSAAQAALAPLPKGRLSAEILRHGSLELRWYAPKGTDEQVPHDRDEVYIVARGRGQFVRAGERVAVGAGDMLFVPAYMEHRFEEFSDDLAAWVLFWGPSGGEQDFPFR